MENKSNSFHKDLKFLMDDYINIIYDNTKRFPNDELFCVTSQLRRSALSVVLNYIEGFARQNNKVFKNFLKISYASLQESKYLIEFSLRRKYLREREVKELLVLADKIGAMLWGLIKKL